MTSVSSKVWRGQPWLFCLVAITSLLAAAVPLGSAWAQKQGGVLRITHRDSPASMSIHEEGTISVVLPMMGVFNNLVMFDPHKRQNSLDGIVPDLADQVDVERGRQDADLRAARGRDVARRQAVHRGRREMHLGSAGRHGAGELQGQLPQGLVRQRRERDGQRRPRGGVQSEGAAARAAGPARVGLHAGLSLPCLAGRDAPAPIGTGPFKFVEYKANQSIKVARNPNYWKPGRPYLDGIEYTIIPNRSTAILAFVSGKFDMTFPYEITVPLVSDVKSQMPTAICDISPMNVAANVLMNPVPPFDDLEVRRAVAMTLDRKAFVDILTQGQGDVGGAMQPLPEGRWGLPDEMLRELPGYDPDVAKSREKARAIMAAKGYGPSKPLKLKLSTAQPADLPRRLGHPDQPAQGDLHRRRAAAGRDGAVGAQADPARLPVRR